MPLFRRFAPVTLLSLLAFSPLVIRAQQNTPPPPDAYSTPPSSAPANRPAYPDDNWLPRGMDSLGSHATFHTDFTFNRQMLGLASDFDGDEETQHIVGNLRSISLHIFRFPHPGLYNPEALAYIRSQYFNRGWHHLVTAHSNAASMNPGSTDLWIRFAHSDVEGMVLLVSNPTNIDLIVINGTLSPLDLLHLRGHFGIPRFSGDRFVPDNGRDRGGYQQDSRRDSSGYSGDVH
jgi:Domain of unknown function (DUF4252)